MRKKWIVALSAIALALAINGKAVALNFADDTCPDSGGAEFIVDTAAEAATVANGYSLNTCILRILTSIVPITESNLTIQAGVIVITGPDVLDPTKDVEIINPNALSDTRVTSRAGGVTLSRTTIRARRQVYVQCLTTGCDINIDFSTLISPLDPAIENTGDTRVVALGDVNITNSSVFGKDKLVIVAKNGVATFICPAGGQLPCTLPSVSGVAADLTDTVTANDCLTQFAGGQPCTVEFADPFALNQVCQPGIPGLTCGGGESECQVNGALGVDLTGSNITCASHFNIFAKNGPVLAGGANLVAARFNIDAAGPIDLVDAVLLTNPPGQVTVTARAGCPAPPAACIDATGADVSGNDIRWRANNGNAIVEVCEGILFDVNGNNPNLNSDFKRPYTQANVVVGNTDCLAGGFGATGADINGSLDP